MELFFLVSLLAVIVWLNRGMFGFGPKGCSWMKSDAPAGDGSWKWMCEYCGAIEATPDQNPPTTCHRKDSGVNFPQ